jgi:hypothetical protein
MPTRETGSSAFNQIWEEYSWYGLAIAIGRKVLDLRSTIKILIKKQAQAKSDQRYEDSILVPA